MQKFVSLLWEFLKFVVDMIISAKLFSVAVYDNYCVIGQILKGAWLTERGQNVAVSPQSQSNVCQNGMLASRLPRSSTFDYKLY